MTFRTWKEMKEFLRAKYKKEDLIKEYAHVLYHNQEQFKRAKTEDIIERIIPILNYALARKREFNRTSHVVVEMRKEIYKELCGLK